MAGSASATGLGKTCMSAEVFLDTSILVYAAVGGGPDSPKRQKAMELIEREDFATSAQVLQEFFVTVTKKAAIPLSVVEAMDWIEQFTAFPCRSIDHGIVRIAIEKSARFRISYWDAAILAAAESLGCATVLSEDLNTGPVYGGVRILNPFRGING